MYSSNFERDAAPTTNQPDWGNRHLLKNPVKLLETNQSPWLSRLIMIWLAGIVVFLPVKILNLPRNFELVDIWILMGLPVVLLFYITGRRQIVSLSYAVPMGLVLISSLLSTFAATLALSSLIVILKEIYLFVWFIAVTVFLYVLNAKDLRRVLYIWSGVVILHGLLMVAQFFSPEIWQFTNSLGGNTARIEGYRPAGLFICDKAGCANKAAYFQLLGFVPLLLAGFSKKTTALLGIFLFASMLTSGSMGATIAFSSGLIVAIFAIAYLKNSLWIVIKIFLQIVVALFLLGGVFYIAGSQNPDNLFHFERISVGRYERSSAGRFGLWQRGVDALLEHNAIFWGIGPENFRVVDAAQTDNQLHNDTLAFLVERGLLGVLGLALFAGIAIRRAIYIVQMSRKAPERARLEVVVFLAVIVATMVASLTHQLFHTRELWLVLAIQEAVYFRMITLENGMEPTVRTMHESSRYHPGSLVQPKATVDG